MQDSNQGLFHLQRLISGNLSRDAIGNNSIPQLNFMTMNQNDRFNRRASIEANLIKVEEPEQYPSKGRPESESFLMDSKSTLDTQNVSNANSRTSLNMHINNLSFALKNYQIGNHPTLTQSASLNTLDRLPQSQPMGITRPIFGQQPLFSNNLPQQQVNPFQNNFGTAPYQSNSQSNLAANKYQMYQALNNKGYSLQNIPQQNTVAPFANLQRVQMQSQMGGGNHQPSRSQQLTPQQQQKLLAYQQQKENQKKQLQSKMESLMKLEKRLEESKQKRGSPHKGKMTVEGSEMSLSECSEGFSPAIKQEHPDQLYPSHSGASGRTFEEQKSIMGGYGKDAIDIEEDLQKNHTRPMEPSSFTSLDEEITAGGFSSKIANQSGNQFSLNTLNTPTSDSCKTSVKDSYCVIKSMPDIAGESTHNDGNTSITLKAIENLQMIEERGDEENAETPMNKKNNETVPGIYTREERMEKILRYKKKIMKWRLAHPPNRNFLGRSFVAGSKPRIKGKFVSKEEFHKHVEMTRRNQFMSIMPRGFPIFNGFGIMNDNK